MIYGKYDGMFCPHLARLVKWPFLSSPSGNFPTTKNNSQHDIHTLSLTICFKPFLLLTKTFTTPEAIKNTQVLKLSVSQIFNPPNLLQSIFTMAYPQSLNPADLGGFGRGEGYLGGLKEDEFSSFCPPDVQPGTRIIAVCGASDTKGYGSPDRDGWFFSDFFLYHHLLENSRKYKNIPFLAFFKF
jgi:hypothetical protein